MGYKIDYKGKTYCMWVKDGEAKLKRFNSDTGTYEDANLTMKEMVSVVNIALNQRIQNTASKLNLRNQIYDMPMESDITHLTNTKDWRDNADKFHKDAKLCYVDYFIGADDECDDDCSKIIYVLYFTTIPLKEQWGDDWSDAEGGTPYDTTFDENGNMSMHPIIKMKK